MREPRRVLLVFNGYPKRNEVFIKWIAFRATTTARHANTRWTTAALRLFRINYLVSDGTIRNGHIRVRFPLARPYFYRLTSLHDHTFAAIFDNLTVV
jgi:hypothetical protein